jgi:hypothetical protein
LTVSIPQQPINSLEELVAQTEIKPLVKSGTNIHTLFMVKHILLLKMKQIICRIKIVNNHQKPKIDLPEKVDGRGSIPKVIINVLLNIKE